MQQHIRDVYLDRAHFAAGAAQRRGERQMGRFVGSDELRSDYRANWTGIYPAISVAAYLLIDRTYIQASAAANTIKRFAKAGVRKYVQPAIIEYYHMQFFGAFFACGTFYACQEGDVRTHLLAGGAAREQPQKDREVFKSWDYFFDPDKSDMNPW